MEIDDINIKLIKFDKVFKTKKYTLLTYQDKSLKIKLENVDFISSFYNKRKNIFVFKFLINNKYLNFFNELSKLAKNLAYENRAKLFNEDISDIEINNLYFSNLDNNEINVQCKTLEIFKDIRSLNGISLTIVVHISGLWFYQNWYGLCFEIEGIKNM